MNDIINLMKDIYIDEDMVNDFLNNIPISNEIIKSVINKVYVYPFSDIELFGTYPNIDDNIIKSYSIRIPKVDSLLSALIYIHEIGHGIVLESNLNNYYCDTDEELLPMLLEDCFIDYLDNININIKKTYDEYKKQYYLDNSTFTKYRKTIDIIEELASNQSKNDLIKDVFENDVLDNKKKLKITF